MTDDKRPPETVEISLGDLAGIIEHEEPGSPAAAFIREAMATDDAGLNIIPDPSGNVLEFPCGPARRRQSARHCLTHHADGTPLSAEELADALESAVIVAGIDALVETAFERSGEDHEMASLMLLHAAYLMDQNALVARAERILGPRRYGPGNPSPVAA